MVKHGNRRQSSSRDGRFLKTTEREAMFFVHRLASGDQTLSASLGSSEGLICHGGRHCLRGQPVCVSWDGSEPGYYNNPLQAGTKCQVDS